MRAAKAADIIGITPAQMRQAIRKGLIPATKRINPLDPEGHIYDLKEKDVLWYKENRPRPGPKKREASK